MLLVVREGSISRTIILNFEQVQNLTNVIGIRIQQEIFMTSRLQRAAIG